MIPIFEAENINNNLIFKNKIKLSMWLSTLPEIVQVKISKLKKQRSHQQNNYLWGCVYVLISEHTGYSVEEIHEICKLKFNSKIMLIDENEITIGKSTALLTTFEFNAYISNIVKWASFKLGLIIPEPSE